MSVARWIALLLTILAVGTLALAFGAVALSPTEVWQAVIGRGDPTTETIVRTIRLPRILLGLLVGAGLAGSGTALQAALRNPLAEPYLLGVSGGAALGAVLAVAFGGGGAMIPIAAFVGALLAVQLVLMVARAAGGRTDPRILLMSGVVVGAFCTATIMVALVRTPEGAVRGALWWMMGSLGDAQWSVVLTTAVSVGGGLAALLWRGRDLDVLALGEEPAAALGLDLDRTMRFVFITASFLAAATVAAVGLVGFVGLMVPAIARALGARQTRGTIVAAVVAGGVLVVLADLVARTVMRPAELPLGAVTALIGVPFFLWRLRRTVAR